MDPHTFITCLIAVTMLTLTPGVDTMLVIRNSGRGGWWDGATTSLGICCGLFVHATLSALGISIILLKTAWAFNILKYIGAAYLIYLGLSSLRQASKNGLPSQKLSLETLISPFRIIRSLREGFLSNVLNPKTILFYMAFLPQFIDPEGPHLQQSLLVALVHFCIGMFYQCSLAAMVTKAKQLIKGGTTGRVLNGLSGSILVYIGVRLASAKQ
ncbi:LysE family translocator [Desulforhopalus sp. IMCC35007]|uniref:LysE family translocator n=1 Tax=Desulforhopalus sp. IMCC35007 TaxID=2569543 RepID=UPI0010AE2E1B|nr:LysE family translocator [Desulforhopalus sp. IMCC35007]TKB08127.1 LysE family translocator [Desulforhopalus sp. IMCC35007]